MWDVTARALVHFLLAVVVAVVVGVLGVLAAALGAGHGGQPVVNPFAELLRRSPISEAVRYLWTCACHPFEDRGSLLRGYVFRAPILPSWLCMTCSTPRSTARARPADWAAAFVSALLVARVFPSARFTHLSPCLLV